MTEVVLMYLESATGPSKSELYDRLPKVLKVAVFWHSPNGTLFMFVIAVRCSFFLRVPRSLFSFRGTASMNGFFFGFSIS